MNGFLALPENLAKRIEPEPMSGCWLWTGTLGRKGYGRAYIGGGRRGQRFRQAHRVIYDLLGGYVPKGLVTDHLCRVHSCVNPAHLEPVTDRVNILRGIGIAARRAVAKVCQRGHTDWRIGPTGHRLCYSCEHPRKIEWQRRRRAELRLMEAVHGVKVTLVPSARR